MSGGSQGSGPGVAPVPGVPHPRFIDAVLADARVTSAKRGRPLTGMSHRRVGLEALRLAWSSDAFLAQMAYRARVALRERGVPVLPRLLHRVSQIGAQVCIGDPVVVEPGVHIAHGQTVIDGITRIGRGSSVFPHTTVGLRAGDFQGPVIGRNVAIGTGAKVIGPVVVGDGAKIGANAVVVDDVEPGATVVGAPARPVAGD